MKTVNIIISAVVFTALALGLAGTGKLVIGVALVLQAVQFVFLYGKNWSTEREIKGGFNPPPKTESDDGKPDGKPDVLDKIKNQDDQSGAIKELPNKEIGA